MSYAWVVDPERVEGRLTGVDSWLVWVGLLLAWAGSAGQRAWRPRSLAWAAFRVLGCALGLPRACLGVGSTGVGQHGRWLAGAGARCWAWLARRQDAGVRRSTRAPTNLVDDQLGSLREVLS